LSVKPDYFRVSVALHLTVGLKAGYWISRKFCIRVAVLALRVTIRFASKHDTQ